MSYFYTNSIGISKMINTEKRNLCWFSCGISSAVACKIASETLRNVELLYCDTLAYEHKDNIRFMKDVEEWIGKEIKVLKSVEYSDIYDVFDRTRFLNGAKGARCTTELKKKVRMSYQAVDDTHIFGHTFDEKSRIKKFIKNNPELNINWILFDNKITKKDCFNIISPYISIPEMYRLGYKNNNCIGCVKGGAGYWNKIRVDFPDVFERMALMERKLNFALNRLTLKGERVRVFLDELPPNAGNYKTEKDIECGIFCNQT